MNAAPQNRSRIIVAFALLYVLWGSTYLAMRVIVRDLPPYVAGAVRYLLAGPIMLAVLALAGRKVRLSMQDLRRLLVISILLLSIGNIGVLWGEVYVSSGLASLMVALVPRRMLRSFTRPRAELTRMCLPSKSHQTGVT